jgi:quercetin dioxygenase-like cupin family protein
MKALIVAATVLITTLPCAAAAQIVAPKTILENASVRVEVLELPPGTGTGRHQGIETEVGIAVEGTPTVDSPLAHQVLQPGGAYTLPGLIPHDVRNEGDRPLKMYIVLLKRCD